jgi:hypothetical protein
MDQREKGMNDTTQENPGGQPVAPEQAECCCGSAAREHIAYRPVPAVGKRATPAGEVTVVSTVWRLRDYLGAAGVRLGIRRMDYAVAPGLYAVGAPDKDAPVLVSANYKLSFDILRRELTGLNAWVLVLDTKGVNVWCAAGKGTFGTMELATRITASNLAQVVAHRRLIVPQLGAPGIAAHVVRLFCDFTVSYGPVRARDIPRYLAAGMQADAAMRRVTFGARERLAVAWLEMVLAMKKGIPAAAVMFIAMGIGRHGFSTHAAWAGAAPLIGFLTAGIASGTLLTAVLLPLLPGRAFSIKGGVAGIVTAAGILALRASFGYPAVPLMSALAAVLWTAGVSAYLALNFTGCSTYTSLSGVRKEIRAALPAIIVTVLVSAALWIIGRI